MGWKSDPQTELIGTSSSGKMSTIIMGIYEMLIKTITNPPLYFNF